MPRQFEACALRGIGFVAALKWAQRIGLGDRLQAPFGGGNSRVAIMISAYQHHFNVAMPRSEGSEIVIERLCVAGFGVHQITQNDKASCFM